jgi:rhodanese-related sulfurtransferase
VLNQFKSYRSTRPAVRTNHDNPIKYIDYSDLEQEREQNPKLLILDMRSAEEYNKSHIDGSRNIPFFTLRMSINELMQELGKIVVVCADGRTSAAVAFEFRLFDKLNKALSIYTRSHYIGVGCHRHTSLLICQYRVLTKGITGGKFQIFMKNAYLVENDDAAADASIDWLAALLRSPVFQRLPAVNLQKVLMSLEEVKFTLIKLTLSSARADTLRGNWWANENFAASVPALMASSKNSSASRETVPWIR